VVGEVLPGAAALEHPRGAGEEPELVDRRRQLLALGEPQGLAGVLRLDLHELRRTLLERVGDLEQRPLALGRGGVPPALEGLRGGAVGQVDVLLPGRGCGRVDLPGGRVDDVVPASGPGVGVLAVDKVRELLGHGGSLAMTTRQR
jgi:ParB family chromosome partitioning protein